MHAFVEYTNKNFDNRWISCSTSWFAFVDLSAICRNTLNSYCSSIVSNHQIAKWWTDYSCKQPECWYDLAIHERGQKTICICISWDQFNILVRLLLWNWKKRQQPFSTCIHSTCMHLEPTPCWRKPPSRKSFRCDVQQKPVSINTKVMNQATSQHPPYSLWIADTQHLSTPNKPKAPPSQPSYNPQSSHSPLYFFWGSFFNK